MRLMLEARSSATLPSRRTGRVKDRHLVSRFVGLKRIRTGMLNENQMRILLDLATNGECVHKSGSDYKDWRDLEARGYIKGQSITMSETLYTITASGRAAMKRTKE